MTRQGRLSFAPPERASRELNEAARTSFTKDRESSREIFYGSPEKPGDICLNCGRTLTEDSIFCRHCGAKRPDRPVKEVLPPAAVVEPRAPPLGFVFFDGCHAMEQWATGVQVFLVPLASATASRRAVWAQRLRSAGGATADGDGVTHVALAPELSRGRLEAWKDLSSLKEAFWVSTDWLISCLSQQRRVPEAQFPWPPDPAPKSASPSPRKVPALEASPLPSKRKVEDPSESEAQVSPVSPPSSKRTRRSELSESEVEELRPRMAAFNGQLTPQRKQLLGRREKFACQRAPLLDPATPSAASGQRNGALVALFGQLQKHYEALGDSWRERSYRTTASRMALHGQTFYRLLRSLPFEVASVADLQQPQLRRLGKKTREKLVEFLETGTIGREHLNFKVSMFEKNDMDHVGGELGAVPDANKSLHLSFLSAKLGSMVTKRDTEFEVPGTWLMLGGSEAAAAYLTSKTVDEGIGASFLSTGCSDGIWGVGLTTARRWYGLGCRSVEDVREHMAAGGLKLNSDQLIGLELYDDLAQRIPLASIVERVEAAAQQRFGLRLRVEACGSYRRGRDTCGDVDLLLCCRWAEDEGRLSCQEILQAIVAELTAQKFLTHDLKGSRYEDPFARGEASPRSACYFGVCKVGQCHRRIDLKVHPLVEFPFAWLSFTGSGPFNRRSGQRRKAFARMEPQWPGHRLRLFHSSAVVSRVHIDFEVVFHGGSLVLLSSS
eukprot:g20297.t1